MKFLSWAPFPKAPCSRSSASPAAISSPEQKQEEDEEQDIVIFGWCVDRAFALSNGVDMRAWDQMALQAVSNEGAPEHHGLRHQRWGLPQRSPGPAVQDHTSQAEVTMPILDEGGGHTHLSFFQCVTIVGSFVFHFAQHEIGCPIHDAHNFCDIIRKKIRLESVNNWNASTHRSFVIESKKYDHVVKMLRGDLSPDEGIASKSILEFRKKCSNEGLHRECL